MAFTRLRSCRINGFGLGRIPWHESKRYAETYGFDRDDCESLIDLIDRLDSEEIKIASNKEKKSGKNGAAGTGD